MFFLFLGNTEKHGSTRARKTAEIQAPGEAPQRADLPGESLTHWDSGESYQTISPFAYENLMYSRYCLDQ
jgi:hypothetical protein